MKLSEIIEPGDGDNHSQTLTIRWARFHGAKYYRIYLWSESLTGGIQTMMKARKRIGLEMKM